MSTVCRPMRFPPATAAALLLGLCLAFAPVARAQQVPDSTFLPVMAAPTHAPGEGPVVLIDEAHWNFHTASGRYLPFTRMLERDGYRVRPNRVPFAPGSLADARVLVIANALPNTGDWVLPTRPAFTSAEVRAVRDWVRAGGSLWLIADHMPFPGAAVDLAQAFGIEFINGFALDSLGRAGVAVFRRSDGSLAAHVVLDGRGVADRVDSVMTFTGQGFRLKSGGEPLLRLDGRFTIWLPARAWDFGKDTRRMSGKGLLQGALLEPGRGRVAVFGEAAMFSAQLGGPQRSPMGINFPGAEQNGRFALNLLRWLTAAPGPASPAAR